MEEIRRIIFCIGTLSVTGIFGFVIAEIYWKISKKQNPFQMLNLIKAVMLLFCFPLVYAALVCMRVRYSKGRWLLIGEFWIGATPVVRRWFYVFFTVWAIGCLVQVIRMVYRSFKLRNMLKGNVEVINPEWLKIFGEYKERFSVPDVELLQNDMLISPISIGISHPKIILPFCDYDDKQMRIVLEHEMNHIKSRDLLWKKVGLVITWMHWFNPVAYLVWNRLVFLEEVVCDCKSGVGNPFFTRQEYGAFLAGLDDNPMMKESMTALCESKNKIYWRIKIMLKSKEIKKGRKIVTLCSCFALTVAAILPAGIVSVKAADLQDQWIHSTEHAVRVEPIDYADPSVLQYAMADDSVTEIDLTSDIEAYSSIVTLDCTIHPSTRVLYGYRYMFEGDSISIGANCKDSSVTYRIGIKNEATEELTYYEGNGNLTRSFTISTQGRYTVYVENVSSKTMEVEGNATYFN
ncbi:MAG: M56 family metallopeptidase [Lachnospiraceae bacterium]